MDLITKPLILQLRKIQTLSLEGGNKECYLCPYTNDICSHWRFVNETTARKSADKIYSMFCDYKEQQDFIGMDMARKFLEMGFTALGMQIILVERSTAMVPYRSRHPLHCEKSRAATVFKKVRDKAAYDEKYVIMRKEWRASE